MVASSFMDRLIAFITSSHDEKIPDALAMQAKYAFLDTFGVALAGWKEPVVQIVKRTASKDGAQKASLWGEGTQVRLDDAVLVNGAASHALDYDDVVTAILAHPSAPILAAALPLAESLQSSGRDVITAYVIGTEVMIKLGIIMGFRHYDLGWHATDTLGTIGAAAACAYLLRLNPDQTAHAIGIAASTAGGLQKNFGTMTKPLHVGIASQHGLRAAFLAREGLTANREVFERRGFFYAFSGGLEPGELNQNSEDILFGEPFSLLEHGLSVKKFPSCYLTHRIIQGALTARRETALELRDIQGVEIETPPGGLVPLIHARPQTGLHGKFSAQYTVLAAIADGQISLSSFEDEQIQRAEIQTLLSKVKATEAPGVILTGDEMDQKPVRIRIHTKHGVVEKEILHTPGSREDPLSAEERKEKWRDCFAYWMKNAGKSFGPNQRKQADLLFEKGLRLEAYESVSDFLKELPALQETKG